jgi:hypothetical protein
VPTLPTSTTVAVGSTVSGALIAISAPKTAQPNDEPHATQATINAVGISFDAAWLSTVEQRIKASVAPEPFPDQGNGAWLRTAVGFAAVDFFRSTSALLPGEPYIYASKAGDLVAEFMGLRGKMTCVVAPSAVYVFAVAGEEAIEKKFVPSEVVELRSHLQRMTSLLGTAKTEWHAGRQITPK